MKFDHSTFISPLSWRYGSPEMRHLFSEQYKFELWRHMWVLLAEAQHEAGLVSKKELDDLKLHEKNIDMERILEIEAEIGHDVMAGIREFREKAKVGGSKIHWGATSQDIGDNSDMVKMRKALQIVELRLKDTLSILSGHIKKNAYLVCMAFTHLQPAEPTTVGYRLAFYAQDLLFDLELLEFIKGFIKSKGMKGAVGTRASYTSILSGSKMSPRELDEYVMKKLGIPAVLISTQIYTRKFDYLVLTTLASIASSLSKCAADIRILQSPVFGEWSEPFGAKQVGSSAMPFKKNPVTAEKICSLARYIQQLPPVALENASLSYLERTLDDSANRRLITAESFISLDEILLSSQKILKGLVINTEKIKQNVAQFAPFAASEELMLRAVKKGADRQLLHEHLREMALNAWKAVQMGKSNPLSEQFLLDKECNKWLSKKEIQASLDVTSHIGDAPERALQLVKLIENKFA